MNLDYKQIGKNLARRRKELRLKQYEVCERAGINDKYRNRPFNSQSGSVPAALRSPGNHS